MQKKSTDVRPFEIALSADELHQALTDNSLSKRLAANRPIAITITLCNDIQLEMIISEMIQHNWYLRLTKLNISDNQLTRLPESLGKLTVLQELYCQYNRLTSLPESIGQITALKKLKCQCNLLTSFPDSLKQLTSLNTLYCYKNQLNELPKSIGQLTGLQKLECQSNRLTSLPQSCRQLLSVRRFLCQGNDLTALPIQTPNWPESLQLALKFDYRTLFEPLNQERQRFHHICLMLWRMKKGTSVVNESLYEKISTYIWQSTQLVQRYIFEISDEQISTKLFSLVMLNPNFLRIILSHVTPAPPCETGFRQLTHPSNASAFTRFFYDITQPGKNVKINISSRNILNTRKKALRPK